MTERPFSATPTVIPTVVAAGAAIMVVMVGTLVLGGALAAIVAWLTLGAAVLIDFPVEPGGTSSGASSGASS